MSSEANTALVQRFFEEVLNQGKFDVVDELFATNHIHHFPGQDVHGPDELKQSFSGLRTTFPDFHISTDDVIAAGDKVVMRITMHATHLGEGMGLSPTGKQVTYTGIDIFRIAGGKIAERWGEIDTLSVLQQLGVIPALGQTS